MFHINLLASLIQKNEEWIFSQILNNARSFNHTIYTTVINYSWKQSLYNFRQLLIQNSDFLKKPIDQGIFTQVENNVFQSIAMEEAQKCYERGINSQVYLAVIKSIRDIIRKLIANARISENEKLTTSNLLYQCFDHFEIAYIGCSQEIQLPKDATPEKIILPGTKQYKAIFESLSVPIMVIDPFLRIDNYNKAAAKAFPFLFMGKIKSLNGTIRLEGEESLYSKIDNFQISDAQELYFETKLFYNNKECFYLIGMQKIKHSNFIAVTFFELTKWKQLEKNLSYSKQKAENSDRMKTSFLANMSHEIRTPMNAIVGFAELLSISNPTKEEKTEYLNLIKKSSNDLLNIIEDVIDVAKIESKQLNFVPKDIHLKEIFDDLLQLYSETLEKNNKKDVKIIPVIPEKEQQLKIKVDPKRLKQVLSNLISNAIKFTEKGTIEIGYKLSENKNIYFFVKDPGVGIPYHMQKKVFERFVQVEEMIEKNTTGTGLGLTISKNIVQLMGGNIWLTSTPGKGTIFFFYLPYIMSSDEKTTLKPESDLHITDTLPGFSGYVMLIAEDDDTNYFYLRESLKKTGIKILRAKTGMEAINVVENTDNIDIILMDIKMPGVNGIEATRYIKHIKPEIPIIAQTAFAMDNDKQTCIEAGCSDYISKPLKIKTLLNVIYKYIKQTKKTLNHHV
jgi:signal transduction histidine kinase/CheY-like chemotaxis protein